MSNMDFPDPPQLMHTLNTEGELGMFVDPYRCSCETCRNYVAERVTPQRTANPEALRALVNSPSDLGPTDTVPLQLTTVPPQIPGPPPLRRVNAFADALGRTTITYTSSLWTERDTEANTVRQMLQLYHLLQNRRMALSSAADSTQQLDQKISALAAALEAFNVDPLDRGSRWSEME